MRFDAPRHWNHDRHIAEALANAANPPAGSLQSAFSQAPQPPTSLSGPQIGASSQPHHTTASLSTQQPLSTALPHSSSHSTTATPAAPPASQLGIPVASTSASSGPSSDSRPGWLTEEVEESLARQDPHHLEPDLRRHLLRLPKARLPSSDGGAWSSLRDKTLIIWSLTRDDSSYGFPNGYRPPWLSMNALLQHYEFFTSAVALCELAYAAQCLRPYVPSATSLAYAQQCLGRMHPQRLWHTPCDVFGVCTPATYLAYAQCCLGRMHSCDVHSGIRSYKGLPPTVSVQAFELPSQCAQ
ncbi:hypothetical protein M409DRAFT_59847 [Zasmidium cellare ATCC 36951]|uniref:Uncharacterized protein n=1 Tax=Zasmidium cellare ATCC 36951 TaxID=1080233 RepID=A0A6A6C151_ZASCE|nr:uncharacterized protein M409DRAFT_59847 [Zasmidium cellare ATCC 36951]KAF2160593.1 hypothetical protein M409DRAFT_59847 [Zasmidium cellare ATCC 36951]